MEKVYLARDILEEMPVKGVSTPAIRRTLKEEMDEDCELSSGLETKYRALAARANYLSSDRADIAFASKEACRHMSRPTAAGKNLLRRLARYLIDHPRSVMVIPWGCDVSKLEVFSDTDWAGCLRTRKSTSGGLACFSGTPMKHWSITQRTCFPWYPDRTRTRKVLFRSQT